MIHNCKWIEIEEWLKSTWNTVCAYSGFESCFLGHKNCDQNIYKWNISFNWRYDKQLESQMSDCSIRFDFELKELV